MAIRTANKQNKAKGGKAHLYFKCKTLSLVHILGKKWAVDVIEILSSKKSMQFNGMMHMLKGITPRALSSILNDLILAEVVSKSGSESRNDGEVQTSYKITEKGLVLVSFIQSSKQLGINLYSIDASCTDRQCRTCSLNSLSGK